VVKAVKKHRAELVVMPGPGRLIRGLMDYFSGLGSAVNQGTGANTTIQKIIQLREAKADAPRPDDHACPSPGTLHTPEPSPRRLLVSQ
jgi:hypothetical protein